VACLGKRGGSLTASFHLTQGQRIRRVEESGGLLISTTEGLAAFSHQRESWEWEGRSFELRLRFATLHNHRVLTPRNKRD